MTCANERRASAPQDNHPHIVTGGQAVHELTESTCHLEIDRVQPRRAIEGDEPDPIGDVEKDAAAGALVKR